MTWKNLELLSESGTIVITVGIVPEMSSVPL